MKIKAFTGMCPIHGSTIFRLTLAPPLAQKPGYAVYKCEKRGCKILKTLEEA